MILKDKEIKRSRAKGSKAKEIMNNRNIQNFDFLIDSIKAIVTDGRTHIITITRWEKSFNHTREHWNPKKLQTPDTLRTAFSSNRFLIDYITALVSITSHDKKISRNHTKRSKERAEKNQKNIKIWSFFLFCVDSIKAIET